VLRDVIDVENARALPAQESFQPGFPPDQLPEITVSDFGLILLDANRENTTGTVVLEASSLSLGVSGTDSKISHLHVPE
jgi:hypothetical protein